MQQVAAVTFVVVSVVLSVAFGLPLTAVVDSHGAGDSGIARNVRSDLLLLDAHLARRSESPGPREVNLESVPVGGAVDLFYRYGFFSLSVRVVPRNDPGRWLMREPTLGIFDPDTINIRTVYGANSFGSQPFEISLCDDVEELKEAYFRSFDAEGVALPHKIFTGSWRSATVAKNLGIAAAASSGIFSDDGGQHSFVLIKLVKETATVELLSTADGLRLRPDVALAADAVRAGDRESVANFLQNYGSHYVRSITVGDAIYQVLVLTREGMKALKADVAQSATTVATQEKAVKTLDVATWRRLYEAHLAPWRVVETGDIQVASGSIPLQNFVDSELRLQGRFGSYPSLVGALLDDPVTKAGKLEELAADTKTGAAVVGVQFASLKGFVGTSDLPARQFYDETLHSLSALWESNL